MTAPAELAGGPALLLHHAQHTGVTAPAFWQLQPDQQLHPRLARPDHLSDGRNTTQVCEQEYCEGGDLRNALNEPALAPALCWERRGHLLSMDVAAGLNFLHGKKVGPRLLYVLGCTGQLGSACAFAGLGQDGRQLSGGAGHVSKWARMYNVASPASASACLVYAVDEMVQSAEPADMLHLPTTPSLAWRWASQP